MYYMHLLHGYHKAEDTKKNVSAFGCRNWGFACIITGIWPQEEYSTEKAQLAIDWVYRVAMDLLPLSVGAYAADLGPDPRDLPLAARAFGGSGPCLRRIKRNVDRRNVLRYACPLPFREPFHQPTILLITGEEGAGNNHCTEVWQPIFESWRLVTRVMSIREATKREYAAEKGVGCRSPHEDRHFKKKPRTALTDFCQR